MGYNQIHETVVADIFDTLKDGIRLVGDTVNPKTARVRNARSIARATSGLTLAFPVICTNTLPLETATMIAKAIERKNVAMLQMAFSAYNITSDADAISHLSKFHPNLNLSKMALDSFMDAMEMLDESSRIYTQEISAIREDCKRNLNFVLEDSINETSLLEFKEVNTMGRSSIIYEAPRPKDVYGNPLSDDDLENLAYDSNGGQGHSTKDIRWYYDQKRKEDQLNFQKDKQADDKADRDRQLQFQKDKHADDKADRDRQYQFQKDKHDDDKADRDRQYKLQKDKFGLDTLKLGIDYQDKQRQATVNKTDYLTKQLLPSDVKKANEMQPTLMIVNFYVNEKDRDLNVAQQFVCGVKSKLYAIDSSAIINKIITKHVDSDILLKLVKVSTREISFVKDFLLGLDDAKLDSLSRSKKGSGSAIFKALERRALNGKIRRSLRMENSAKAISTLVVSSEEAEELRKYENIDITSPKIVIPIMEKLNLLYFVIVDNTAESVNILTDGETEFETYSFTSLERENGDAAYKKAINLITKLV